jgi:hypothetical protein
MNYQEFVSHYSIEDWVQVVEDAEILSVVGSIGDCRMRQISQAWSDQVGLPHHRAMDTIIREGYRQLALQYIKEKT